MINIFDIWMLTLESLVYIDVSCASRNCSARVTNFVAPASFWISDSVAFCFQWGCNLFNHIFAHVSLPGIFVSYSATVWPSWDISILKCSFLVAYICSEVRMECGGGFRLFFFVHFGKRFPRGDLEERLWDGDLPSCPELAISDGY